MCGTTLCYLTQRVEIATTVRRVTHSASEGSFTEGYVLICNQKKYRPGKILSSHSHCASLHLAPSTFAIKKDHS